MKRTSAVPVASTLKPAAGGTEIERLIRRDLELGNRIGGANNVRRRILRLHQDLESHKRSPTARDTEAILKAVASYKEACAVNKMTPAAVVLACASLTACSSVEREIGDLQAQDRELCAEIDVLQTERKSVLRLITALQEYNRSSNVRNSAALEKARELHDAVKTN